MSQPEKRRPGRPAVDDPRQPVAVRVTAAERAALQAAADADGIGLSVYVREKALSAAQRRTGR